MFFSGSSAEADSAAAAIETVAPIAAPEPGDYTVVATAPGERTGRVTVHVGVEGPSGGEGEVEIRVSGTGP